MKRLQAREWVVKIYLQRWTKSSFTKKPTPSRKKELAECLRNLDQRQMKIAKRKGWDRGLLKEVLVKPTRQRKSWTTELRCCGV